MFASLLMTAALTAPPAVGEDAPDAKLMTLDGQTTSIGELSGEGRKQVVVMLRGWPGYQCPICRRQAGEFAGKAAAFDAEQTDIIFVYPGPGDDLDKHARQFLGSKALPKNVSFVLDPDYTMTNAWDLRWDAPRETAYPATFLVIDGKVKASKVSNGHGGRASAGDVLAEVKKG